MIPYILILLFVIFWVNVEKFSLNRRAFWIPILSLSLFAGMRSYRVGTDTGSYVANYINNLDPNYFEYNETVEKGYQLFDYLILHLTHNYFWLFFITAFFIVYSYFKLIKKYSENYLLSVIIFVSFGTYTFFFNGLRQGIAMAIFTYAISALLNKKLWLYLTICLIASTFHTSALVMIPFYFVVNVRIKLIYKIIGVMLTTFILASPLIRYMADENTRYEAYTTNNDYGGILTLVFYVFIAIFILIVNKKLRIKSDIFTGLFTLYLSGISLLIPIAMLGAGASGPQRILYYFSWTLMIILPVIINSFKSKIVKLIFIILCVFYFYLTTSRFSNLTPYILNSNFEILS